MRNVVAFENTKRKLDWKQEQQMKEGKRKGQARRDVQREGREAKWGVDNDE